MKSALVIVPTKELVLQNEAELLEHWPGADVGVACAGLRRDDLDAQILIATPGTYHNRQRRRRLRARGLLLIDEAHRVSPNDETMIRKIIVTNDKALGRPTPILGLTATPSRTESGLIYGQPDSIFDTLAYRTAIGEMIDNGWLAPIVAKDPREKLDTSGIGIRAGDFKKSELNAAVDRGDINRRIVEEIVERGANRQAWLVFASGVDHARNLANLLREAGISTEAVFGSTPKDERKEALERFRHGAVRAMVNVDVLTTGFNVRHIDLIALARPTMSPSLYAQMAGRGTRTAEGKTDCLLLDFGGNVERHGPITDIRTPAPRGGKAGGPPPLKVCPGCDSFVAAGAMTCPDCGHEWERAPVESKLDVFASDLDPMGSAQIYDVYTITIAPHHKPGKPPSAAVAYQIHDGRWIKEWVMPEHGGFPSHKARQWFAARSDGQRPPKTTAELLRRANGLKHPSAIRSYRDGRFDRIEPARFADGPGPHVFVRLMDGEVRS